jgi:hypothetical protein
MSSNNTGLVRFGKIFPFVKKKLLFFVFRKINQLCVMLPQKILAKQLLKGKNFPHL